MTTGNEQNERSRQGSGNFDPRAITDRLNEISEPVKAAVTAIKNTNFNENTVPDAFRNVPKAISPKVHAWLDFAVTTYFLGVGVWCAIRGKRGATTAAFLEAGMVAGMSLLTDYSGNGQKPINFKLHGTLDAVQGAMAAMDPLVHGFAGEPEAAFFYGQAANELAVIALTDWDKGMPAARRRQAA
jgi:hypothetical protein